MPSLIDLSHPLRHGQPSFPGDPELRIEACATIASGGCNLTRVSMGSHQGTHLDAPRHFFDDGPAVDELPLAAFYGPATLVDLAAGAALEPDTPITVEMLQQHADAFEPAAKVIYRTGWDRQFGRAEFFEHYPWLTVEAARWIARRRIGLLGMDTPTPGRDAAACHRALLQKGTEIVIVEGLANLDRVPARFTFIGFPLKLAGRDGSPIRAVAVVE
jgi:arylformamidase